MKTVQIVQIQETYGAHPNAELEVIDEGDKIRVRVREPHDKVSIFLTRVEFIALTKKLARYVRADASSKRKGPP